MAIGTRTEFLLSPSVSPLPAFISQPIPARQSWQLAALEKNIPGIASEACSHSHARPQLTAAPWRPQDTTMCLHPSCPTTYATPVSSTTARRRPQPPTPPETRPSSHGRTPRKAKLATNEIASIEHIGGASSEPAKSLWSAWS